MFGTSKMCLFASFMLGATAGYMYHDYYMPSAGRKKRGKNAPVIILPKSVARKAKKLKRDLQETWEDML